MEIVRLRLIGPQSHTVLAEALEAATDCDVRVIMLTASGTPGTCFMPRSRELTFPSCLKETSKSQPSALWWPEHCKDESKMHLLREQADVYHILKGLVLFFFMLRKMFIGFLICH